ncbi:glycoside hydrolase family 128 protein [Sporormia fimetaria CBS 119925]|uniref:Glycoside hydrolase family 128 protein n=1 Tax=Sporormia fimetaria CBS 119925 TaxID=1340428 RepID=A0A6A6V1S9_9PLEO|nr:glycoside hydrolase family 128 protein [Sporormia fimetaria CBS 119925]
MSSSLKFGLLALISTAAAAPHYGHGKFHKSSGAAYPTGGWGGYNSTIVHPTGTGVVPSPDEQTTTIDETYTSTTTLVSTIYITASPVEDVSSTALPEDGPAPSSAASVCGPETVYATVTDKVTVTVTSGASPSSKAEDASSTPPAAPTSEYEAPAPGPSEVEEATSTPPAAPPAAPTGEYEAPAPQPSETADEPLPTFPKKGVEAPAPSPSSAPPSSGAKPKMGLAYNDAALCKNFAGKASWAYSWGSTPGGDLPEGVSFIPMPWTKNEDAKKWLGFVDDAISKGTDTVMGFNEPDLPAQANMSPEVACQRWAEYMDPIKAAHPSVTILGPSVTNDGIDENKGLQWLAKFQKACPGAKWDAANIHFYDLWMDGDHETDMSTVGRFKKQVQKAHDQTGKDVWVTEFGLFPDQSAEDSAEFLREAVKYMDSTDFVKGYSYFMVGTGPNQLNAGDGLSAIGEVYASS